MRKARSPGLLALVVVLVGAAPACGPILGGGTHAECTDSAGNFVTQTLPCHGNAIATCKATYTCDSYNEECTTTRIFVELEPCPADRPVCVDQFDLNGPASVCQVAGLNRTCASKLPLGDIFKRSIVADLDNDGRSDLLGFDFQLGMNVALGLADGTFRPLAPQPVDVVVDPLLGDFDGDGRLDLLTSIYGSSGFSKSGDETYAISISAGRGDGTFAPAVSVPQLQGHVGPVAVIDVNGDKSDDLIGWDQGTKMFTLLLGATNGQPLVVLPPQHVVSCDLDDCPSSLSTYLPGDFNEDGYKDFVFAEGPTFLVVLGSASGVLKRGPSQMGFNGQGDAIPADIDGDGHLDVVVASAGSAWIFPGKGDATFGTAFEVSPAPYFGVQLVVSDFDGDGVVDIAFEDAVKNVLVVRRGTGGGKFDAPRFYQPSLQFWWQLGALTSPTTLRHDLLAMPFVVAASCQ